MSLSCDLFRAECHCIWQLLLQQGFLWQLQPLLKSPAQWGCIQGSALNNCSPLRTLRSQSLFLQGKIAAISGEFCFKIPEPQPGLGWALKQKGLFSQSHFHVQPWNSTILQVPRLALPWDDDKSHPKMREKEKVTKRRSRMGITSSSTSGCDNSNPTLHLTQNLIQATSFSSRADRFQWLWIFCIAMDILPTMKTEYAPFNFYQPFLKPSKTRAPSALQGIICVSDKKKPNKLLPLFPSSNTF